MMGLNEQRYLRSYSELEGLQSAYTVEYLLRQGAAGPEIEVRREGGAPRRQAYALGGCSAEHAQRVLRFLYENAVSVENLEGVLADCGLRPGAPA